MDYIRENYDKNKWGKVNIFIDRVARDIDAVKNQILIKETNSTVESLISKIKTLKKNIR